MKQTNRQKQFKNQTFSFISGRQVRQTFLIEILHSNIYHNWSTNFFCFCTRRLRCRFRFQFNNFFSSSVSNVQQPTIMWLLHFFNSKLSSSFHMRKNIKNKEWIEWMSERKNESKPDPDIQPDNNTIHIK